MVLSLILHVAAIVVLIELAPYLAITRLQPADTTRSVTLIAPMPEVPVPPAVTRRPIPKPVPIPPPKVVAALTIPRNKVIVTPPKIEEKRVVPQVPILGTLQPNIAPVKPKVVLEKQVVMNNLDTGSSAKPTIVKPIAKVQTGGFGEENGVRGTATRPSALNAPALGSFELPAGQGRGNGTGGTHGATGAVASAGFGGETATRNPGNGRGGTVATTGFGNAAATTGVIPKVRTQEVAAETPVQIQYKPKPIYTQDARDRRIEGEVVLEVLFGTSGDLKIQRVVRGLGYGLDEAAVKAANQIRFRPALRSGQPYASTALVHIVFELAQ
jgi:TonB family protein